MGGQPGTITRRRRLAPDQAEDTAAPTTLRRGRRGVVDAFDLAIVEQLAIDGRMSTKQIAEAVGLTDATVATRVRALTERDVLRVRAIVDWDVAGFRSPMVFFVRVHGRSVKGIADRLMADPQVHSVSEVFGSADLVARVLLADPTDAMSFAEETFGAIDGIELVMSLLDVDVTKHDNGYHTGAKAPTELPAFPAADDLLDAVDVRLVECLVQDARQSLRQIGRILDVSEHTVRARLRRLEETGLVRICAQVDHDTTAGTGDAAYLGLRTNGTAVQSTIEDLVGRPECRSVDRTVGEFDILALLAAPSRSDLAEVVDGVRSMAGIQRSETWLVSSHQLSSFPWARF